MPKLLWFSGISHHTEMFEIGWTWVVLTAAFGGAAWGVVLLVRNGK